MKLQSFHLLGQQETWQWKTQLYRVEPRDQTSARVFPHLVLATPCSQALQLVIRIVKAFTQCNTTGQVYLLNISIRKFTMANKARSSNAWMLKLPQNYTQNNEQLENNISKEQFQETNITHRSCNSRKCHCHLPHNNIMVWTRDANAMGLIYFSSLNQWY